MKKLMILVAAAAMAMAPMASAARVVFVGGGPVWGPGFYGPYGGPGYWGPAYASVLGEVRIDTKAKDDEVFVNGAFAGVTKDMKSFRLREGTYTIEVRHAGVGRKRQRNLLPVDALQPVRKKHGNVRTADGIVADLAIHLTEDPAKRGPIKIIPQHPAGKPKGPP